MRKASFEEYLKAKCDIISGKEWRESNQQQANGRDFRTYSTDSGNFFEVNDNGIIEFWSTKHSISRIYEDYQPCPAEDYVYNLYAASAY